jgi:hypothetical protein
MMKYIGSAFAKEHIYIQNGDEYLACLFYDCTISRAKDATDFRFVKCSFDSCAIDESLTDARSSGWTER